MPNKKPRLPRVGMRTIKTAICVLICLVINHLFGQAISLNAAIAAIVCMQSTIENTFRTGANRLIGTAFGGAFGMLLLFVTQSFSAEYLYLILMPLGIIASIYMCNAAHMPGSAVICAIVYISVLVSPLFPAEGDTTSPYLLAVYTIIDTAIGIVVAMLVNRFIMPPRMYESRQVHLACDNTFTDIYERVKSRLSGTEQLILYDSTLTRAPNKSEKRTPDDTCGCSVRIPVPTEYTESRHIYTMHISASYTVTPIYLPQEEGYVEIPGHTFPCTTVWQPSPARTGDTIDTIPIPFKKAD